MDCKPVYLGKRVNGDADSSVRGPQRFAMVLLTVIGIVVIVWLPVGTQASDVVESVWSQAYTHIEQKFDVALEAYRQGKQEKAVDWVMKAQFNDYKNTLLETAVRRYISQAKDYENNAAFTHLVGMLQEKKPIDDVKERMALLLQSLASDLPGLPLVEGAISKRAMAKLAKKSLSEKDWAQVVSQLCAQVEASIHSYGKGNVENATAQLQDAYFDSFEASGMAAKVGQQDAALRERIEGCFSKLVEQMQGGASVAALRNLLSEMRTALDNAVAMLGQKRYFTLTTFFYVIPVLVVLLAFVWMLRRRKPLKV